METTKTVKAVKAMKAVKSAKVPAKAGKSGKNTVQAKKPSISRIVFGFINEHKLLEADNRKEKYAELEALVKADFPESKFQKTHFYWYLTRAQKQVNAGISTDHLEMTQEEKDKRKANMPVKDVPLKKTEGKKAIGIVRKATKKAVK